MSESYELDPIDRIAVGTVGPPGRRQFFLRAERGPQSLLLKCEKFHVQGLIARIAELLEAQGVEVSSGGDSPPAPEAGEPEWTIGELGLGYHEARGMFVIVAREAAESEEQEVEQLATARLWATPEVLQDLARQAAAVVVAGRPPCPHCGLPVDPSGHPCPAANGSRPVL
jgi:uncharacterized repeat protein (TIGR03847 family)